MNVNETVNVSWVQRSASIGCGLAVVLAPPIHVQAQDDEDDVFELSPFVVDVSEDTGYRAQNTLAGSRLNAQLKDIPSQISVMTSEFLDDMAATNPEDIYKYSLNVEGVDEYQASGEADDFASGTIVNIDRARVRGIATPAFTQNFFLTKIRHDNYNMDRITFSSGPNAVIYGLGSPGGIIDTQFKRANLEKTFGEFGLRISDFGGHRVNFDFNKPIVEGKLGLRVALLDGDEDGWRDPSSTETDRKFVTLQAAPWENTNIRAYWEDAELDTIAPLNTAWFDAVTPWIEAGRPLFDNGIDSVQSPSEAYWTWKGQDNNVWVINDDSIPIGSYQNRMVETSHRSSYHDVAFEASPFGLAPSSEPLIAEDFNIRGNGSRMHQDSRLYGFVIDHRRGENLNLEFGFNRESADLFSADPITQEFSALKADPNMYLADGVTPNPHAGQLYIEGIGRIRKYTDNIEEMRFTASYNIDLREQNEWLGNHNFTVLYQDVETENSRNTSDMRIVPDSDSFDDVVTNYNRGGVYTGHYRYYLDEEGISNGDPDAAVQWPWDTIFGGPTGQGSVVTGVDNPYGATFQPTYTRSQNKSYMAALQSHLFDERLITTFGYRQTDVTTYENNLGRRVAGDQAAFNTIDDLDHSNDSAFDVEGQQSSIGVVYKVTDNFRLFYNDSDTWDSPLGIHHTDDSRISAPIGEGKDYGFMVSAFDDKVFLRVNLFENSAGPLPAAIYQDKVLWRLWFIEKQIHPDGWQQGWGLRDGDTPLVTSLDADGNEIPMPATGGATFNTDPTPDYLSVVSDQEAEGVEIELTANWPENWVFQWTLSQADVIETNIGKETLDYVDLRLDHWAEWAAWEAGLPLYDSVYSTNWTFINPAFDFMSAWLGHMQESDGKSNNQGREWRSNFTARYSINEGAAKGLSIGATHRYRSGSVIGYGTKSAPHPYPNWPGASGDILVPDRDKPIKGNSISEFDAFLTYNTKIANDKYDLRLQLNIRNLLDNSDYIEQKAISTGEVVNYTYPSPREFIFSTTLGF